MWEWLDSAQLEKDGLNNNSIKEEGSKIQKKIYEDMCRKTICHLSKEGKNPTLYIYID